MPVSPRTRPSHGRRSGRPSAAARPGSLGAVVELLALSYADHRDYDDEWRP
ncbi:DUF6221 family protein [Blastococcus tunisiensis]|uniref:DUF6221 family protein n=1 Tax=Blastococcus tunisiensis TaxID=1798228 RepID=UPI003AA93A57